MLEGLWWLQRKGSLGNSWRMGGSLHSPQEEYQGTSTPSSGLVMWSSAFSVYPANFKLT